MPVVTISLSFYHFIGSEDSELNTILCSWIARYFNFLF